MIITSLIVGLIEFLRVAFSILPFNLGAMPSVVSNGLNFITDNLGSVMGILKYAYTPTFFTAIFVLSLGVLFFDYLYGFFFWVIRKIPFINIH